MDSLCDLCRMRQAGHRTSESLPYLNDHICEECKKPPVCRSCKSKEVHLDGDIGWGYVVCLDCGYCVEHECPEPPKHLQTGKKFSEEMLAWIDENTEYRISIIPNFQKFLK